MVERYRSIVDVHLILVRASLLMLTRRANTGYTDGLLHMVSGHLEPGEDVVAAIIREADEEIGIGLAGEHLECVHVTRHRNPAGIQRERIPLCTSRTLGAGSTCPAVRRKSPTAGT